MPRLILIRYKETKRERMEHLAVCRWRAGPKRRSLESVLRGRDTGTDAPGNPRLAAR